MHGQFPTLGLAVIAALATWPECCQGQLTFPGHPRRILATDEAEQERYQSQLFPVQGTSGLDRSEGEAVRWTQRILRPAVLPPAGARYVFIPRESDVECDRAFLRYDAGDLTISITQAHRDVSIELSKPASREVPRTLAQIEAEFNRVFQDSEAVRLSPCAEAAGGVQGSTAALRPDPPGWLLALAWRQDPGRIVFRCGKTDLAGGVSVSTCRGVGLYGNQWWFRFGDGVHDGSLLYRDGWESEKARKKRLAVAAAFGRAEAEMRAAAARDMDRRRGDETPLPTTLELLMGPRFRGQMNWEPLVTNGQLRYLAQS